METAWDTLLLLMQLATVGLLGYLFSYCIGKGWFKAKLEFHRQHMKWMNKELDNG